MIYFTAHTFKCVCHCRRAMFRVLGMYNFDSVLDKQDKSLEYLWTLAQFSIHPNCHERTFQGFQFCFF